MKLMQVSENNDKGVAPADNSKDSDRRVYELGYLLLPTVPVENIPASYSNLKDLVVNTKGEIISDEMPKEIKLAYPILKVSQSLRGKFDMAYFGWIKFEMDAESVLDLKKKVSLHLEVLRFLIIKTVRENTVPRRFIPRDFKKKTALTKGDDKTEPSEILNKEEIDKEIDAMVTV